MSKMHKGIRLVCLLTLVAVLLAVGVTYARYSTTRRETLTFEAAQNDPSHALEIRSDAGWRTTAEGVEIAFSLCNAANVAGQRAYLRLTATEGFDPAVATVTLTVDGTVYEAVPRAVREGDPLYASMGTGTEYRFTSVDGEPIWEVSPTSVYTLTVEGEADASLLRLTATAV